MKALAVVLALCLVSAPLAAQDLPESTTVYIEGERYEAFNAAAYIQLIRMQVDLGFLRSENVDLRAQTVALQAEAHNLRLAIPLLENGLQAMTEDRDRISLLWEETNLQLRREQNQPRLGTIIGWSVAALLAALIVGQAIEDRR